MNFFDFKIGATFSFHRSVIANDIVQFARLSGDFNPLHLDPAFGKKSIFKQNIAQGMLLGGFFSALVGMYCPGEKALYLSQTLNFKLPVFVGDLIEVRGAIVDKSESTNIITLKTEIVKGGRVAVSGEAKVKVLE